MLVSSFCCERTRIFNNMYTIRLTSPKTKGIWTRVEFGANVQIKINTFRIYWVLKLLVKCYRLWHSLHSNALQMWKWAWAGNRMRWDETENFFRFQRLPNFSQSITRGRMAIMVLFIYISLCIYWCIAAGQYLACTQYHRGKHEKHYFTIHILKKKKQSNKYLETMKHKTLLDHYQ